MTAPFTLPTLDDATQLELRHRYKDTRDAKTWTRYQMLLHTLAQSFLRES